MSDLMNRREFLGTSAAGAGSVLLGTQLGQSKRRMPWQAATGKHLQSVRRRERRLAYPKSQ